MAKNKEKKQVVTPEEAERMFAQAWPAKRQKVGELIKLALDDIGQRYGVTITGKINIVPAFLAGGQGEQT